MSIFIGDPYPTQNGPASAGRASLRTADAFFSTKRKWIITSIIVLSFVLRLVYFHQVDHGPLLRLNDNEESDMRFFQTWALDILNGDILTNKSLHPYCGWQKEIAATYFSGHPDAVMALANDRSSSVPVYEPGRILWNRWFGGKQFHQEPLYPYLIAATYKVLGVDVRWILLLQMAAGIYVNILLYQIARFYFGDTAAVVSAFLAVFYGPLLYYDMILVRSTFVVCLQLALIWSFEAVRQRKDLGPWFLLGLLTGIAVLLKMTFLLFVAAFACVTFLRRPGLHAVKYTAVIVLGMLISLSPAVARNVIVGTPPMSLSSVGTVVFITNNDRVPAELGPIVNVGMLAQIMGRTEGKFLPAAVETMKSYGSVGNYLDHLGEAISKTFNWYEAPNNTNFYLYRFYAPVLRFTFITFLILAPLSLAGLVLSVFRKRDSWPLYIFIALQIALLLGFGVSSRYRMPLVVLLIPFAAFALVEIAAGATAKAKSAFVLVALVLLLSLWTSHSRFNSFSPIRAGDYIAAYLLHYRGMVDRAAAEKDFSAASETMRGFLEIEPLGLQDVNRGHPVTNMDDARLVQFFSYLHRTYAELLQNAGNTALAVRHEMRANDLAAAAAAP